MATARVRQTTPGVVPQGEDEVMVYTVTLDSGSAPTSVSVAAYDVTGRQREDVTATVLTGAAAVVDNVITLPELASLTAHRAYRIEVKYDLGSETLEDWFIVNAEE